jgi:Holliday junction resolvase RusA-like endonuclease
MTDNPQMVHRGHTLVNNPAFWEAVNTHFPDFSRIKEMIAEAYQAETGRDDPTQRELSSWLIMALRGNPALRDGISTGNTPARQIILPSLAIKFDYIMSRPCYICMPYQEVNHIRFFLRTDPVSLQADHQSSFKKAVKVYLAQVNHDFSDFYNERLCVAVLFAMRGNSRMTDVDNMAKPLLDALEKYAYDNDRQIDHLDTIRLNSGSADEAFIGVRIARTGIAENEDVIRPEFDAKWIKTRGIASIDLTPFLKEKKKKTRPVVAT